jgi:hypothetical protein
VTKGNCKNKARNEAVVGVSVDEARSDDGHGDAVSDEEDAADAWISKVPGTHKLKQGHGIDRTKSEPIDPVFETILEREFARGQNNIKADRQGAFEMVETCERCGPYILAPSQYAISSWLSIKLQQADKTQPLNHNRIYTLEEKRQRQVHSIKAMTKQRILEQNITSWRYLDKLYDGVSLLNDAGLEEVIVAVQVGNNSL